MDDSLSRQGRAMTGRRATAMVMAVLWLAALMLVVKAGVDRFNAPSWGNAVAGDLSPEVAGDTQVGQAWRAPLPGLYRIELFLEPPDSPASKPVTFHLRAGADAGPDIWTAAIDPGQIRAGVPYAVEFEPVRDAKAKTFYFSLESPESRPGEAVQAVYGPGVELEGGSALLNGQAVPGNLTFQTYYSLRTREKVDLLLERMAQGRPYFLGSRGFYVVLAAVYGLVLLLLLWSAAGKLTSEDRPGP
ncbi:MAG: hypothetical protein PHY79_24495 [Anaerolineae bacterium]|nr:hypothetical protein [Anaerolineae bacterium]